MLGFALECGMMMMSGIMGKTHRLVDRGRSPPCLVYSEGEHIDCAWVQLGAEYSHSTAVTPLGLLCKMRLCGFLKYKHPGVPITYKQKISSGEMTVSKIFSCLILYCTSLSNS